MGTRLALRMPDVDLQLPLAALGLVVLGLLMVFSATHGPGAHEGLWVKQLGWALAAILAAWLAASLPVRLYDSLAYPVYVLSIVFLVLVLVMGSSAYGAKR